MTKANFDLSRSIRKRIAEGEFDLSERIETFRNVKDDNLSTISVIHIKEFIRLLKKSIDISADKTDIWDSERWTKFRKILLNDFNKLAGKKLSK